MTLKFTLVGFTGLWGTFSC